MAYTLRREELHLTRAYCHTKTEHIIRGEYDCCETRLEYDLVVDDLAMYGWLNVIRWYVDNGARWGLFICINAVKFDHLNILQWATPKLPENDRTYPYACNQAALSGHLHIFKWLRANCFAWDDTTLDRSIQYGHIDIAQWMLANGYPHEDKLCGSAAFHGNLDLLKWAHANGYKMSRWACCNAANNGHFEILKWLRANGCPWDASTCSAAACRGHREILEWCLINGCEWDRYYCTRLASGETLIWINSCGEIYPSLL